MKNQTLTKVNMLFCLLCFTPFIHGQDGELLDIDISIGEPEWYENPYLWIGAAIVILLLILVLRRKG